MLRILLLGPPKIYWDKQPVDINRRIPRMILYYLAARGQPVTRSDLILLFFGNQSTNIARRRLRENLSRLRSQLPDPTVLVRFENQVGLDFERVWVDQLDFEALVAQAGKIPWQIHHQEPLPEHIYAILVQALKLWQGPRYLLGVELLSASELSRWVKAQSIHLERLYYSIIERLAQHEFSSGKYAADCEPLRGLVKMGANAALAAGNGHTISPC